MDRGLIRPGDPMTTGVALWAAVHGIAALWTIEPALPHQFALQVAAFQQDAIIAGLGTP